MMIVSLSLSLIPGLILQVALFLLLTSLCSAYKELSDDSLGALPSPGKDFDIGSGSILAPILQVRVAGTQGNILVRHHFVNYFKQNLPKWELVWQNSTQPTILGKDVEFSNIIFRRDPPWARKCYHSRLAIVAHYDSKMEPPGFIGAIDSAAPCAMIMHAAQTIDAALTKKWDAIQQSGQSSTASEDGIELYFLDGEEAFQTWTATDSIYGARSLANELEKSYNPASSTYRNEISQISLFVLLDLLGSSNPRIPSYFPGSHWSYKNMAKIETRLRALGLMESSLNHQAGQVKGSNKVKESMWLHEDMKDTIAEAWWMGGLIEDDHMPFFSRGVPCLHLIPTPFPAVWHTMEDDGKHLDLATTNDWAKMVTIFAAEWMELEGYLSTGKKIRSSTHNDDDGLEPDESHVHKKQTRDHDEL